MKSKTDQGRLNEKQVCDTPLLPDFFRKESDYFPSHLSIQTKYTH